MRSRSFARNTVCFAAAAVLSSCGGSDLLQISRTWSQQSVADKALPDTVPNSTPVIVITLGDAEISNNGTYTFVLNGTSDGVAGVVGQDAGRWTITNSLFIFTTSSGSPDIPTYYAVLAGSTFRVAMPGVIVHSSNPTVDMGFAASP